MAHTRLHLAALITAAYVIFTHAASLVHFAYTGSALALRINLTQTENWLIAIVGFAVAWGIWHRFNWAWWLGVAAALFQLFREVSWIAKHASIAKPPGAEALVLLLLLLAFLVLVLPAKTRAACSR